MKKMLRITMSDGSVWHAEALPIAEDRANYYAHKVDGEEIGGERWKDEVAYAMEDETELREWSLNNMNWDDLQAVMVKPPEPPDPHKMWMDAEFDLVED